MKKTVFSITGGIVICTSIFLIAYYSFSFFNKNNYPKSVDTLEITLSDEGSINLDVQELIDSDNIDNVLPYKFTIRNKGNSKAKYEILLEDVVSNNVDTLDRKNLRYQLKENNNDLITDRASNIKNNKIYEGTINAKQEKKYELRVSLIDGITDEEWVGKTYKYSVKINPIVN